MCQTQDSGCPSGVTTQKIGVATARTSPGSLKTPGRLPGWRSCRVIWATLDSRARPWPNIRIIKNETLNLPCNNSRLAAASAWEMLFPSSESNYPFPSFRRPVSSVGLSVLRSPCRSVSTTGSTFPREFPIASCSWIFLTLISARTDFHMCWYSVNGELFEISQYSLWRIHISMDTFEHWFSMVCRRLRL